MNLRDNIVGIPILDHSWNSANGMSLKYSSGELRDREKQIASLSRLQDLHGTQNTTALSYGERFLDCRKLSTVVGFFIPKWGDIMFQVNIDGISLEVERYPWAMSSMSKISTTTTGKNFISLGLMNLLNSLRQFIYSLWRMLGGV